MIQKQKTFLSYFRQSSLLLMSLLILEGSACWSIWNTLQNKKERINLLSQQVQDLLEAQKNYQNIECFLEQEASTYGQVKLKKFGHSLNMLFLHPYLQKGIQEQPFTHIAFTLSPVAKYWFKDRPYRGSLLTLRFRAPMDTSVYRLIGYLSHTLPGKPLLTELDLARKNSETEGSLTFLLLFFYAPSSLSSEAPFE